MIKSESSKGVKSQQMANRTPEPLLAQAATEIFPVEEDQHKWSNLSYKALYKDWQQQVIKDQIQILQALKCHGVGSIKL
jgi:hypothetical protein